MTVSDRIKRVAGNLRTAWDYGSSGFGQMLGSMSASIQGDSRYWSRLYVYSNKDASQVEIVVVSAGARGGMDGPGGSTPSDVAYRVTVPGDPRSVISGIQNAVQKDSILKGFAKNRDFEWRLYRRPVQGITLGLAKAALATVTMNPGDWEKVFDPRTGSPVPKKKLKAIVYNGSNINTVADLFVDALNLVKGLTAERYSRYKGALIIKGEDSVSERYLQSLLVRLGVDLDVDDYGGTDYYYGNFSAWLVKESGGWTLRFEEYDND